LSRDLYFEISASGKFVEVMSGNIRMQFEFFGNFARRDAIF
jgi:hypothetical protein